MPIIRKSDVKARRNIMKKRVKHNAVAITDERIAHAAQWLVTRMRKNYRNDLMPTPAQFMLGVVVDTGEEISDTLCQILPRLRGAICAITNKSEGLTLGLMTGPCDLMLEEDDAVLGFYVVASLQWLSPEDVFDVV